MKKLITLFALMLLFAIGAQAQIVGANEGPKAKTSNTSSSLYKPTGHYLRFEAGYPTLFSIAYCYQLNSNIMIGTGCGFGQIPYNHYFHYIAMSGERQGVDKINSNGIPIYVETVFSTPKYKWAYFIDVKIGGNITSENLQKTEMNMPYPYYERYSPWHFFGALNIGMFYKNFSFGIGVSSNNVDWYSFFISYNLPLRVH